MYTYSFNPEQFNRIFPSHFLIDRHLRVRAFGETLRKLVPHIACDINFNSLFIIKRPLQIFPDFDKLQSLANQLVIIETNSPNKVLLRGQFEYNPSDDTLLFLGSPWFESMDKVLEHHLTINDFAVFDPLVDLLNVLKTQEIVSNEMRELLVTISHQKDQLKMLSMIAEETINAAVLTDANGNISWVNTAFTSITGYTLEEVHGKRPGSFLQGQQTDPETVNYLRNQIRNGRPFNCEIVNYNKNGNPYWVKISGKPLFDSHGNLIQFFALEEDITQSKNASVVLEQTASRLSAMLTNLRSGILLEDETRHIVIANNEFCRIFRIPVEAALLTGMDCSQSAQQSKTLFRDPEQFEQRIETLLEQKRPVTGELLEMADGTLLERDYIPVFVHGKYQGHLWSYSDITEKYTVDLRIKHSEEKYRGIMEKMELGVIEVDNDGIITNANQSFCEITGYAVDELIGKDPLKFLLPDEKNVNRVVRNTKKRHDGISSVYETNIKRKDGKILNLLISGGPLYDAQNNVVGSIGIHLDISERKQLELSLMESKRKSEALAKAKQAFLANMSHEMRTPLNAIVGLSNFMLIQNPPSDIRENLDILNFSANNLLALITDILDFSKIEAGKIEFVRRDFNLHKLMRGVYQTFLVKCEEKGISIDYHIDKNIPVRINGDQLRLTQVLNNLVHNSIKFTNEGGITISIKPAGGTGSDRLLFEVTDTGIGIAKHRMKKIFEDFTQADPSISQKYGGTGLGLAITKQLIEMQGGKVGLKSKLHKGSTFYFELPFAPAAQVNDDKQVDIPQPVNYLNGKRVLLVEDNLINQRVAKSYLQHWEAETTTADNGSQALEIFQSDPGFDILLVDLYMPVMDGFHCINAIRQAPSGKSVPIIALTASAELSVMQNALDCGADDCLSKPFNVEELQNKISLLLKKYGKADASEHEVHSIPANAEENAFQMISLKRLQEAALGSESFVDEMLDVLSEQIPVLIKEADAHLHQEKFTEFAFVIHKLKNNLLMLGLDDLKQDLRQMEDDGNKRKNIPRLHTLFRKLQKKWPVISDDIRLAKKREP